MWPIFTPLLTNARELTTQTCKAVSFLRPRFERTTPKRTERID